MRCQNCRFVSYSRSANDCSWYSECNLGALNTEYSVEGHHTAQIKSGSLKALTRPRRIRPSPTTPPPTALIVYHIPKTGGTALMNLLSGFAWRARKAELLQQGAELRLPLTLPKGTHECFFALFPEVFPEYADANQQPLCLGHWRAAGLPSGRLTWQRHAIVVEHHGGAQSMGAFFDVLEPRLPQLRLLYAAHNGTLLTTTTVRSPRALVRSAYKMWPPRVPAASPEGAAATRAGGIPFEVRGQNFIALPFDYFLRRRGGTPSTGLSMTQQLLVHYRPIQCDGSLANSSALAARARRRLRAFDVVGVTECTRRYWRVLGSRLGWSNLVDETIMDAAEKREHNEWYKPKGMEVTPELRKFLEAQADADLDPPAVAALEHAAACDAALYADGLLRAGLLTPTMGERAEEGSERNWLAEAQAKEPLCEAAR